MFELALITFAVVASIGPTNLYAIKEGTKNGASKTFFIIFGGVLVDLFYANLAGLGLSALGENFYFKTTLLLAGSIFFIHLGINSLKSVRQKNLISSSKTKKQAHPLFLGIFLTLPNPFTIIFWATAFSSLSIGYKPLILLIVILSVGTIWALIEAGLIHFSRKYINGKLLRGIETITSLIILGFAGKFIYQFLEIIMETTQLSVLLYSLGKVAGIIGFVCLSFLIFSGDTARFWDKLFGLDKIIKFQRKFALVTTIFVLFHPLLFILSGQSALNYLIPDFSVLPLAIGITAAYLFMVIMFASAIYKRISYNLWQIIHVLTYLLFFFSLYHATNWGSDSETWYLKSLFAILLTAIIIGIIYRTQYKIRKKYANKFFIKTVNWETKDTFTLTITPQKKFTFKAGQFCFLRLNKNNLHARHPFTMSSSPTENDLKFTIKNTGRFTKEAANLKSGEEILLDGPFGKFYLKDHKKDLIFIAGGVGITPFSSMLEEHVRLDKKQKITLIYGSKTIEDIIFKDKIDAINQKWFKKICVLSQSNPSPASGYLHGYINKTILEQNIKNIENTLFYICGPEQLKKIIKKILTELKIKKKNIFIENFFW